MAGDEDCQHAMPPPAPPSALTVFPLMVLPEMTGEEETHHIPAPKVSARLLEIVLPIITNESEEEHAIAPPSPKPFVVDALLPLMMLLEMVPEEVR